MKTMRVVLFDDELFILKALHRTINRIYPAADVITVSEINEFWSVLKNNNCLLYTSPSPRDGLLSRMPSSA